MPHPRVRAQHAELGHIARQFTSQATNTERALQRLHAQLDVLMLGDWVGQGATQFYREMISDVLPAYKRLAQALRQAGQVTDLISGLMRQAETDAARVFRLMDNGGAAAEPAETIAGPEEAGAGGATSGPSAPPGPPIAPTPAPSVDPLPTTTTLRRLNFRTGPDTSNPRFTYIPVIPEGAELTVLATEPVLADNHYWYQVQYTDPTVVNTAIAASPDFLSPLGTIRVSGYAFGTKVNYDTGVTGDWVNRHVGLDYAVPEGENQIVASATGTVVDSGFDAGGYGHYAIVEYPADAVPESIRNLPGYVEGDSVYVIYAHMANAAPAAGSPLAAGDAIGVVGSTGNSDGAHLHVELRFGEPDLIDPNSTVGTVGAGMWSDPDALLPIDPGLIFPPTTTYTGWVAGQEADGDPIFLSHLNETETETPATTVPVVGDGWQPYPSDLAEDNISVP